MSITYIVRPSHILQWIDLVNANREFTLKHQLPELIGIVFRLLPRVNVVEQRRS